MVTLFEAAAGCRFWLRVRVLAVPCGPAIAPGGGVPLALGCLLPGGRGGSGWLAGGWLLEPSDGGGDEVVPGPSGGEAEAEPAAAAD